MTIAIPLKLRWLRKTTGWAPAQWYASTAEHGVYIRYRCGSLTVSLTEKPVQLGEKVPVADSRLIFGENRISHSACQMTDCPTCRLVPCLCTPERYYWGPVPHCIVSPMGSPLVHWINTSMTPHSPQPNCPNGYEKLFTCQRCRMSWKPVPIGTWTVEQQFEYGQTLATLPCPGVGAIAADVTCSHCGKDKTLCDCLI